MYNSSEDRRLKIERVYGANPKITSVLKAGDWGNKSCFIIGGGESVKGLDFNILKGNLTIGINKTFEYFSEATINYSMDAKFYENILTKKYNEYDNLDVIEKWNSFKGLKIFLTPLAPLAFSGVYLVKRNFRKEIFQDLSQGIYGGNNSCTGALMLAATLGANPIYLLGYDFKAENKTHWHTGYPDRNINDFRRKLVSYCREISSLVSLFALNNIKIYNLSSNSLLTKFPFLTLEKALWDCKRKENLS